ncbi:hypothetical protein V3C99_008443 [Haemonchus contortus]|uniref:Terminase_6C domain-containing protein n=1 Tax=Haemonchus contortus TaxID=6289 RepID=A0A7I5EB25_HAECO
MLFQRELVQLLPDTVIMATDGTGQKLKNGSHGHRIPKWDVLIGNPTARTHHGLDQHLQDRESFERNDEKWMLMFMKGHWNGRRGVHNARSALEEMDEVKASRLS